VVVFASGNSVPNSIMAVFSVIFYLLMVGVAFHFNRSLRQAQRVSFENEDLIGSLKEAYQKISAQNLELNHVAHHDILTGLPNRKLLAVRMQQALEIAEVKKTSTAILYLDLNGFKAINDQLGHEAGDMALIEVSRRLGKVIRGSDTLARVGGDEFVIVLSDLQGNAAASVEMVANKCLMVFEQLFDTGIRAEAGRVYRAGYLQGRRQHRAAAFSGRQGHVPGKTVRLRKSILGSLATFSLND
jgi:diguanylate cyclase (GGDEF)-like protein